MSEQRDSRIYQDIARELGVVATAADIDLVERLVAVVKEHIARAVREHDIAAEIEAER